MSKLETLTQVAELAGEAFVCDPTAANFQAFANAASHAREEFERRIHETYEHYEAAKSLGVRS